MTGKGCQPSHPCWWELETILLTIAKKPPWIYTCNTLQTVPRNQCNFGQMENISARTCAEQRSQRLYLKKTLYQLIRVSKEMSYLVLAPICLNECRTMLLATDVDVDRHELSGSGLADRLQLVLWVEEAQVVPRGVHKRVHRVLVSPGHTAAPAQR